MSQQYFPGPRRGTQTAQFGNEALNSVSGEGNWSRTACQKSSLLRTELLRHRWWSRDPSSIAWGPDSWLITSPPWPCRTQTMLSSLTRKALTSLGVVLCLWAVQWWVCAHEKPGALCLFQPEELMGWAEEVDRGWALQTQPLSLIVHLLGAGEVQLVMALREVLALCTLHAFVMQQFPGKIRNSLGGESGTSFLSLFNVAALTQESPSIALFSCVRSVSSLAWW